MAGRPAKPTRIKQLEGNPGKRSLNTSEPRPAKKRPPCPKHLQGEARREWNRMSKQLFELDLLTVVDRAALAAYCQAWADWVFAHEQLAEGSMITVTEKGYPVLSPWWSVATTAAKQMKSFLTEFGMSPGSRSRIQIPGNDRSVTIEDLLSAAVDG